MFFLYYFQIAAPDAKKKRDDDRRKNDRSDKKKDIKRARSPLGARGDMRNIKDGKLEKGTGLLKFLTLFWMNLLLELFDPLLL